MIVKTLLELQLEEEILKLKRENQELSWKIGLSPGEAIPGFSTSTAVKMSETAFSQAELRLAAGAGYESVRSGIEYFGYITTPRRFELGVFIDTETIWNETSALYHLDNLNHHIQSELLAALKEVPL